MKTEKLVGIVMSEDSDGKFWNNANYFRWISACIGHPVIVDPYSERVNIGLDLLILPGGSDVNPLRYMDHWPRETGLPNRGLEYFDQKVLPKYIENGVPIMGICRGLQTLNVLFGGTLHPDVPEPTSFNDGDVAHYVRHGTEYFECSSNHHQSIAKLGDGFTPIMIGVGRSFANNKYSPNPAEILSVEAIMHNNGRIFATQFHPEKQHAGSKCRRLNTLVHQYIASIMAVK